MRRPPRAGRRVLALLVTCMLVLSLLVVVRSAEWTSATWRDDEIVGGTFTAADGLPGATLVACDMRYPVLGILIFTSVEVQFSVPDPFKDATDVAWVILNDGTITEITGRNAPTVAGPDANGVYTATFSGDLLRALLSGLLGDRFYIGAKTQRGSWTQINYTYFNAPLLGIGRSCTPNATP